MGKYKKVQFRAQLEGWAAEQGLKVGLGMVPFSGHLRQGAEGLVVFRGKSLCHETERWRGGGMEKGGGGLGQPHVFPGVTR